MEEVYAAANKELKSNNDFVIASVVRTSGSTPQKPGAKLLVKLDDTSVGTLGGGCVEGDIWFASKEILKRGGVSSEKEYYLNEDIAAQDGLVCGGTMYFLIDPVRKKEEDSKFSEKILNEVNSAYAGGEPVALGTLIKSSNPEQFPTGKKILVRNDGSILGDLGSKELNEKIISESKDIIPLGRNKYLKTDDGNEVFIEAFISPPTLIIAGGGHVGKALAPIASSAGFRIFVSDDRKEFANKERFPMAEIICNKNFETCITELPVNTNTFIVIATRGHRFDDVALEAAARTKASYVALLGSKRKTILIFEELIKRNIPIDRLSNIKAPAGLDIGARTPEEIAISIVAEMVAFRFGGTGKPMQLDQKFIDKIKEKILTVKEKN